MEGENGAVNVNTIYIKHTLDTINVELSSTVMQQPQNINCQMNCA